MGVTDIVLRIVLQVCRIVIHGGIMWKLACCNVRRFWGQILWRPQGEGMLSADNFPELWGFSTYMVLFCATICATFAIWDKNQRTYTEDQNGLETTIFGKD